VVLKWAYFLRKQTAGQLLKRLIYYSIVLCCESYSVYHTTVLSNSTYSVSSEEGSACAVLKSRSRLISNLRALTVTAKKNSKNACAKKRNACSSNLGLTSDLQLLEYWNYWPHDLLSKWPRFCRHHSSFQARFDNKSRQVRSWRCDGQ